MVAMRLVIVTESFLPGVDGVSRSVTALTAHCRRHGHDALVVAPGHGPHEVDGFPVIRVMGVRGLYPGLVMAPLAPGMNRLLERFAPDVVHLASPAVLGAAALRAARRRRLPVAAHFQTDVAAYARHYGGGPATPLVWRWFRRLHNRCDVTYAPTERTAAELRARGLRRVSVSGRGVDLDLFRPDRPGAGAARRRWAPGGLRVLCVARLAAEKDLQRLVDVARQRDDLSILLVGDGPHAAELTAAAPPNLRLAGLLEGGDLADTYAAAELFAFPSATETFGQVVQEAMASGLAVVGMRAGGVADLVP
jgi:phosphatidylinositol alpha 1,6-mannosyltransferase